MQRYPCIATQICTVGKTAYMQCFVLSTVHQKYMYIVIIDLDAMVVHYKLKIDEFMKI